MRRRPHQRVGMRVALVAAALGVALSACGGSGSRSTGTDATASGSYSSTGPGGTSGYRSDGPSASAPTGGAAAPAVLQFKAPLLAGGAFDGTTYTGKPVAFWFWAPW